MENSSNENLFDRLNDFLTKNRSSLSVNEVKQLEELLLTKKGNASNEEDKESKKEKASNAIKQLLGFILKHEVYNFLKEFLD